MTSRELNMVYGESNEINGEKKIVLSFTVVKNFLLLIRSEKNCTFKLGVEKKFDHEGKTIAPHVSNGPRLNNEKGLSAQNINISNC